MKGAGKRSKKQRDAAAKRLGRKLRRLREAKKLSGREIARRTQFSQSTISKIENGTRPPTLKCVVEFAEIVGLSTSERIALCGEVLGSEAETKLDIFDYLDTAEAKGYQKRAIRWEATSDEVFEFQSLIVPGLLQGEEYFRRVLRLQELSSPEAIELAVEERNRRKEVLRDTNKSFCFVMTESALRFRVCEDNEMIRQLERIKEYGAQPHIRVLIIPWAVRGDFIPTTSVYVYDDMAYIELLHAAVRVRGHENLELFRNAAAGLIRAAVEGREADEVLEFIAEDFNRLRRMERTLKPSIVGEPRGSEQ